VLIYIAYFGIGNASIRGGWGVPIACKYQVLVSKQEAEILRFEANSGQGMLLEACLVVTVI
jgi:hypothetical protein